MVGAGDKMVWYRGGRYRPDTMTKSGKGKKAHLGAIFTALAAVSFEEKVVEKHLRVQMRATATFKGMTDAAFDKEVERWMGDIVEFAGELAPYATKGTPKSIDGYGLLRPMDAMQELFYSMDRDQIISGTADVVGDVREAWETQKRLSNDELLVKYLEGDKIQAKVGEILAMQNAMLLLKKETQRLVEALEADAKKEVDPTARWWGDTITFMSDADADTDGHSTKKRYKYLAKYPTSFKITRADCGNKFIHCVISKGPNARVRCDLRQGKYRKTVYAEKDARAPASNAARRAIAWLTVQHGNLDATVNYNFPRLYFKWEKVDVKPGDNTDPGDEALRTKNK